MTEGAAGDAEHWDEVTIPIRDLVSRVGPWVLGTVLSLCALFGLFNGWSSLLPPPLTAPFLGRLSLAILVLLAIYLVSVPIHEALHAVGMIVTGTPASAITFGTKLRQGVVYIHCRRPMSLNAYRFSLLLPVIVTGLLPAAVGVVVGHAWVTVYAALMILSAIGDLEMVWRLRHLSGSVLVRDHPDKLGCEVRVRRNPG